jgi:hypothetical protein
MAAAPPVAEQSPADVAQVATTLKLAISHLELEPELAPSEPTHDDVGRLLGTTFMPSNTACVGLPAKVQGVYKPTVAPPNELDGDLVYAPGLTLDDLAACYVALGGDRSGIRSLGPAVRDFPGFSLDRTAFVDLGHGWLFEASDVDKAIDQLGRVRTP